MTTWTGMISFCQTPKLTKSYSLVKTDTRKLSSTDKSRNTRGEEPWANTLHGWNTSMMEESLVMLLLTTLTAHPSELPWTFLQVSNLLKCAREKSSNIMDNLKHPSGSTTSSETRSRFCSTQVTLMELFQQVVQETGSSPSTGPERKTPDNGKLMLKFQVTLNNSKVWTSSQSMELVTWPLAGSQSKSQPWSLLGFMTKSFDALSQIIL